MYIAYSALQIISQQTETNTTENNLHQHELLLRYQAYQTICSKYTREIAAIQKYLPGWQPVFK
jgi:hypothetical protein